MSDGKEINLHRNRKALWDKRKNLVLLHNRTLLKEIKKIFNQASLKNAPQSQKIPKDHDHRQILNLPREKETKVFNSLLLLSKESHALPQTQLLLLEIYKNRKKNNRWSSKKALHLRITKELDRLPIQILQRDRKKRSHLPNPALVRDHLKRREEKIHDNKNIIVQVSLFGVKMQANRSRKDPLIKALTTEEEVAGGVKTEGGVDTMGKETLKITIAKRSTKACWAVKKLGEETIWIFKTRTILIIDLLIEIYFYY